MYMDRSNPSRSSDLARIFAELTELHELIASLSSRISRLEARAATSNPSPEPADPVSDLERLRDEVTDLGASFLDRFGELVSRAGASVPQGAPTPMTPPSQAPDRPMSTGEGAVRLDAGPFADLGALLDFERSLTSLPAVKDVNLQGFQAGRAILEVSTSRPAQIIEDLHSLPVPPLATEVGANGTVVLTVGPAASGEKEPS